MDSLLNEYKNNLDLKRGDKVRWVDTTIKEGRYVMASSAEGYIVVSLGGRYGTPKVIPISMLIK